MSAATQKCRRQMLGGYVYLWAPDHHRANSRGYVAEHILVVERALGKPLLRPAEVHHVNQDRADNRPENLVVCQDSAHHLLLHRRQRALDACGHADWLKCSLCFRYDAVENGVQYPKNNHPNQLGYFYHRECASAHNRKQYLRRMGRAVEATLA